MPRLYQPIPNITCLLVFAVLLPLLAKLFLDLLITQRNSPDLATQIQEEPACSALKLVSKASEPGTIFVGEMHTMGYIRPIFDCLDPVLSNTTAQTHLLLEIPNSEPIQEYRQATKEWIPYARLCRHSHVTCQGWEDPVALQTGKNGNKLFHETVELAKILVAFQQYHDQSQENLEENWMHTTKFQSYLEGYHFPLPHLQPHKLSLFIEFAQTKLEKYKKETGSFSLAFEEFYSRCQIGMGTTLMPGKDFNDYQPISHQDTHLTQTFLDMVDTQNWEIINLVLALPPTRTIVIAGYGHLFPDTDILAKLNQTNRDRALVVSHELKKANHPCQFFSVKPIPYDHRRPTMQTKQEMLYAGELDWWKKP